MLNRETDRFGSIAVAASLGGKQTFVVQGFKVMRRTSILIAAFLSVGCASRASLPLQTASNDPCVPFGGHGDHDWLTGDYDVVPVAPDYQAVMMRRVKRGDLKPLDPATAKAVLGGNTLPRVPHFYLIRVGYVGLQVPDALENVSLAVDVDSEGVAYVSSFVLSVMTEKSEAAAVLASPTPLKRVISTCGSAV